MMPQQLQEIMAAAQAGTGPPQVGGGPPPPPGGGGGQPAADPLTIIQEIVQAVTDGMHEIGDPNIVDVLSTCLSALTRVQKDLMAAPQPSPSPAGSQGPQGGMGALAGMMQQGGY